MRDLELFRCLQSGTIGPEHAADLCVLAGWPLQRRMAWLGVLGSALESEHAQVRAAAVRALEGAVGMEALEAIIAALDDDHSEVRHRAVCALRAVGQPWRMVHALVHPRADVRVHALEGELPDVLDGLVFCLLADPACREALARRGLRPGGSAQLRAFMEAGMVHPAESRPLLEGLDIEALKPWLEGQPQRDPETMRALVQGEAPDGEDAIDAWLGALWGPGDDCARALGRALEVLLSDAGTPYRARALASALSLAKQGAALPLAGAAFIAVLHPLCVVHDGWSADARRAGLHALRRYRDRLPSFDDDALIPVLQSEHLRGADGRPELRALIALLRTAREPLPLILDVLGPEAVHAAFERDVRTAALLFTLPDHPRHGHVSLLAELQAALPHLLPRAVAWALVHRDAGRVEPLMALSRDQLLPLLQVLLEIVEAGEPRLVGKRLDRIAQVLGSKLAPGLRVRRLPMLGLTPAPRHALAFLRQVVAHGVDDGPGWDLLQRVLGALCRALRPESLGNIITELDEATALALLAVLDDATAISGFERDAVARGLRPRATPAQLAWAHRVLTTAAGLAPGSPPTAAREAPLAIEGELAEALRTCDDGVLEDRLRSLVGVPHRGLASCIAARETVPAASTVLCSALLGGHDPPEAVAAQLERCRGEGSAWWGALDAAVVDDWRGVHGPPPLVDAWLWRWDDHAARFTSQIIERGLEAGLREALALPSLTLRDVIFGCVARSFDAWRWRRQEGLRGAFSPELVELLVELLDTELGHPAARMLATLHRTGCDPALFAGLGASLEAMAASLTAACRYELSGLASFEGVPAPARPPRVLGRPPPAALLERIQGSDDLDWLSVTCASPEWGAASEAALRLVALGEPGQERLVEILLRDPPPPAFEDLAESVAFWEEGASLQRVRDAIAGLEPAARFRLALPLAERGEEPWVEACVLAAAAPGPVGWFRPGDWSRLRALRSDLLALAEWLAPSPHPAAHTPAVRALLEYATIAEVSPALVRFLEADWERPRELRVIVARRLADQGDRRGFPILLPTILSHEPVHHGWRIPEQALVDVAAGAVLVTGGEPETQLLALLSRGVPYGVTPDWGRLLRMLQSDQARRMAADRASLAAMARRRRKLEAVADVFAWGQWRALELTGKRLRVHMTAGHRELGHTRLSGSTVHVSPLPLLRGERRGREVVEGLVLHEIGHHLHHGGRAGRRMWKAAQDEGIFPLLNLVADEHLERNLRAHDRSYGDRFKALASYAFQHSEREFEVGKLVQALHVQAFAVLCSTRMAPGWKDDCVRIGAGQLLRALSRGGDSFARFMRALRMGLGDRHGDPKVIEALALFRGRFRHSSTDELLDIARQLRRIFGDSGDLAELLGGHEGLRGERRDQDVHGDSITNREVQREVERILKPPRNHGDAKARGRGGKIVLNVGSDERFAPISNVQPLRYDAASRRALGNQVARHARRMRGYLERLGLRLQAQGGRLRGSRFDRTRARAVVTHGDPRILVAREPVYASDLFLGIAVDCSGSMASERSMEKAKLFAALMADACRGLRGVDLRVIGFTDRTIYDAGDAERCAVSSLPIEGGNNDAAGLAHLADLAFASHRRARLLVMISDGLPTECSTTALAGLVRRLERRGLCVAQVAVQPLQERCFTHYIELDEANIDVAVRSFGTIIARLVHRALRA